MLKKALIAGAVIVLANNVDFLRALMGGRAA